MFESSGSTHPKTGSHPRRQTMLWEPQITCKDATLQSSYITTFCCLGGSENEALHMQFNLVSHQLDSLFLNDTQSGNPLCECMLIKAKLLWMTPCHPQADKTQFTYKGLWAEYDQAQSDHGLEKSLSRVHNNDGRKTSEHESEGSSPSICLEEMRQIMKIWVRTASISSKVLTQHPQTQVLSITANINMLVKVFLSSFYYEYYKNKTNFLFWMISLYRLRSDTNYVNNLQAEQSRVSQKDKNIQLWKPMFTKSLPVTTIKGLTAFYIQIHWKYNSRWKFIYFANFFEIYFICAVLCRTYDILWFLTLNI